MYLTWATPLIAIAGEVDEDVTPAQFGFLVALSILTFYGLFLAVGLALYLVLVSNVRGRRRLWAVLLAPLAANLLFSLATELWQSAAVAGAAFFFGYSLYLPGERAWWQRTRVAWPAYLLVALVAAAVADVSQRGVGATRTSVLVHVADAGERATFGLECRYSRAGRVADGHGSARDGVRRHPRPEAACRALESARIPLDDGYPVQRGCPRRARSGRIVGVFRDARVDFRVAAADIPACTETAFLGGEAEALVPAVPDEDG